MYACDEAHAVVAQVLVERGHQLPGIVGGEMSAMMVLDASVRKADDVAADGHVVGAHLISDGGRLEWSAALVHLVQVVAHDGGVGHLAAWRESFGHGHQTAGASFPGEHVDVWGVGILQRGLSAEPVDGMVGHAVAKNDDVFHDVAGFRCWRCS